MQPLANRIRPKSGFSYILHIGFNALLPIVVFIFVRTDFTYLALLIILLSKWRMFAVRPRYWLANVRANGIDIIFGLSILIFMTHTQSMPWQLLWVVAYVVWLTAIKPGSNTLYVSIQAVIGQLAGFCAMFVWLSGAPLYQLIIGAWLIAYLAARHFFNAFEEPFTSFYAHSWGYFSAALTWVLGHWLIFYGSIAQETVIVTVISIGIGSLYYLDTEDKLNKLLRRQILLLTLAIIVIILVFSNWSSRIV